jgi:hypothetical protein
VCNQADVRYLAFVRDQLGARGPGISGGSCPRIAGAKSAVRRARSWVADGADLTTRQVAERAGITRDALRKVETGNAGASLGDTMQVLYESNLTKKRTR